MEHILFLTGHLARPSLERVLAGMAPAPFTWEARDLGLQVAGLMTADMVSRRLPAPAVDERDGQAQRRFDRIILPGRCRGDLEGLARQFGIPVQRGPEEVKDLPAFFDRAANALTLDDYQVEIFAEIVDAPRLAVPAILERARRYAADGANVIDLGCLPETPFGHLEESVQALKAEGFRVSVDSVDPDELLRGGKAGADYLLSLTLDTLWLAEEVAATPVLIPRVPSDVDSLHAAVERMQRQGRPFLADAILDPIPFGLAASIVRYHSLRERFPDVAIMMGVGNLTELTEADTSGINAVLFGICAELQVAAVLTTQVSPHACRAVKEADWARRIMHAARSHGTLPKGLGDALLTVHARKPFLDSPAEIAALATQVRDPNFRVQVSASGLHVYNRDGLRTGQGAFELWPQLGLEGDAAHAFYMGVELAHAELAHKLGKRYAQDQPLDWGCAVDRAAENPEAQSAPGTTKVQRKTSEEHAK